jgi:hypothetical protein
MKQKLKKEKEIIENAAIENKNRSVSGQVICSPLKMMKPPEDIPGFLKVFPNFKHQNRKDGYGCKNLSPKAMGPIVHSQPGLPIALNLENFWQFSKVFPDEVDEKGNIKDIFFTRQKEAFQDPIPYRHKPNATGNIPLYSVFIRKSGEIVTYKYVEARQFYCNYYERFAKASSEFSYLQDLLSKGYNLQICGYDAYKVTIPLEKHYLDSSKPFGHEMVLYTMLTEKDESKYPWRKYKTEDF